MEQSITFWEQPTARRYESLVRENVMHVGKVNGFKAIDDFFFTYAQGYVTLSHDNIDVLFNVQDDIFVIIEWPKCTNKYGRVDQEIRLEYKLSDYPLIRDLAIYLENKHS